MIEEQSPTSNKTSPSPTTSQQKVPPKIYLLIRNPKKSNNLGPILRCAVAYQVYQIIFVGYEKCSTIGSHGSAQHINVIAFPTFEQAVQYVKCHVSAIVGVLGDVGLFEYDELQEVSEDVKRNIVKVKMNNHKTPDQKLIKSYPPSFPIHKRPFSTTQRETEETDMNDNICFSISKEWSGLPIDQAQYCDFFLHIPRMIMTCIEKNEEEDIAVDKQEKEEDIVVDKQEKKEEKKNSLPEEQEYDDYGLLDPQTSLSITLHHYTAWAKYKERTISGQKFELDYNAKGLFQKQQQQQQEQQREKRIKSKLIAEKAADTAMDAGSWGNLFLDD